MSVVEFPYKAIPVFQEFHNSKDRNRAVIGGYGSGKSTAGCAEAIRLGLEYPGSEILVTRKTVPSLRDTTEKTFLELLPPEFLAQCDIGRAGGHLEHLTFPNGSNYVYRSMDDWKKHRSMNLAFIFWDEADEFTPEDYEGMQSRIRQTKPLRKAAEQGHGNIARRGNILACNPQGKNWIWKEYVSPDAKPNNVAFLSSSLDNPFLPLDFINELLEMPDAWVKRYVLCSFEDFSGAIYPDWGYETHFIKPIPMDHSAGFFVMGFDPGTYAKNAAVWCYYQPERHRLVAVAEYAENNLAASTHAEVWRRTEHKLGMKRARWRVADPVVTTKDRGSNMELSEQYRRLGFSFQSGPRKIETRLTALGQLITQGRFVATTDCPMLFDQLKAYQWEDLTPTMRAKGNEPKPLKRDVDLVDAAQYIATQYISPPKLEIQRTDVEDMTARVWKISRRKLQNARNATQSHDLGSLGV